jgi:hypothetical protein
MESAQAGCAIDDSVIVRSYSIANIEVGVIMLGIMHSDPFRDLTGGQTIRGFA